MTTSSNFGNVFSVLGCQRIYSLFADVSYTYQEPLVRSLPAFATSRQDRSGICGKAKKMGNRQLSQVYGLHRTNQFDL